MIFRCRNRDLLGKSTLILEAVQDSGHQGVTTSKQKQNYLLDLQSWPFLRIFLATCR